MSQRTSDYRINDTIFRVTYGNITQIVADVLVSSDDNYLTMGGGVSMALLDAGGRVVQQDARKHIPLNVGDVVVTSAGHLSAKYIFHAVTIDYDNMIFADETGIRAVTLKCMQLADTLGQRLIAFPALGTKAKYGIDVPLYIENGIEDLQREIDETEVRAKAARGQLASLTTEQ